MRGVTRDIAWLGQCTVRYRLSLSGPFPGPGGARVRVVSLHMGFPIGGGVVCANSEVIKLLIFVEVNFAKAGFPHEKSKDRRARVKS